MKYFFKEIKSIWRFCKIPEELKEIVFYSEREDYYPYFEGILEKLTREHNRSICYITSSPADSILKVKDSRVKAFYLNILLPFFMAFIKCKVFVLTLTDLNQFHLKRSVYPVKYVYIFHSLASTHMKFRAGAYDHYDCILCPGPYHKKEIRRRENLYGLREKELVEAGYYRLERIYKAYREYCSRVKPGDKKTVLIAPSWGGNNVLEACGCRLTEILLNAGFEVIARPHPETLKRSPALISRLQARFSRDSRFKLERSVFTDDSLFRADVLICDSSGVAFEYAFGTERPVLFLDVPLQINNDNFKELGIEPLELRLRPEMGVVVSPEKLEAVPGIISELIAGSINYKERLARLRGDNIYQFGRSSDIGAQRVAGLTRLNKNGLETKVNRQGY